MSLNVVRICATAIISAQTNLEGKFKIVLEPGPCTPCIQYTINHVFLLIYLFYGAGKLLAAMKPASGVRTPLRYDKGRE